MLSRIKFKQIHLVGVIIQSSVRYKQETAVNQLYLSFKNFSWVEYLIIIFINCYWLDTRWQGSFKNSNDTIGNRTRDLPVCSVVPQTTAPPKNWLLVQKKNILVLVDDNHSTSHVGWNSLSFNLKNTVVCHLLRFFCHFFLLFFLSRSFRETWCILPTLRRPAIEDAFKHHTSKENLRRNTVRVHCNNQPLKVIWENKRF